MKNDELNNFKAVVEKLEAERRLIESKLVHVENANKVYQFHVSIMCENVLYETLTYDVIVS